MVGQVAIVMTTTVEIMRRLSCQFWYTVNDPGRLLPGMIPADSELCKIAAVEVLFGKVINFEAVVDAVGALISFALVGKYGDKNGRRTCAWLFVPCNQSLGHASF
ncbi:hypothetical protein FRC03_004034 [Tulasnella sp. 419]|nr:hypothetical protein FRC03_004034 [Tulasnella sp. 419]